jgi:hypothetical protein
MPVVLVSKESLELCHQLMAGPASLVAGASSNKSKYSYKILITSFSTLYVIPNYISSNRKLKLLYVIAIISSFC